MSETKIEWTAVQVPPHVNVPNYPPGSWYPGFTFNPWWGCEEVSPACAHCYAKTWAERWGFDIWGRGAPFRFFGDHHWDEPRKLNAKAEKLGLRLRVFCGSMCDWLQDRPDLEVHRARLLRLIDETPALDWLMLSKRPENLFRLTPWNTRGGAPRNVMLGTTVEDQKRADERIPALLAFPSTRPALMGRRFLSCEPLLGDLNIRQYLLSTPRPGDCAACGHGHGFTRCPNTGGVAKTCHWCGCSAFQREEGIHWVIVGSESGHPSKVRETRAEWVESLRDQCAAAGVPFFLKQLQNPDKPAGRVVSLPMFQGRQHRGQPGESNA